MSKLPKLSKKEKTLIKSINKAVKDLDDSQDRFTLVENFHYPMDMTVKQVMRVVEGFCEEKPEWNILPFSIGLESEGIHVPWICFGKDPAFTVWKEFCDALTYLTAMTEMTSPESDAFDLLLFRLTIEKSAEEIRVALMADERFDTTLPLPIYAFEMPATLGEYGLTFIERVFEGFDILDDMPETTLH